MQHASCTAYRDDVDGLAHHVVEQLVFVELANDVGLGPGGISFHIREGRVTAHAWWEGSEGCNTPEYGGCRAKR